MVEARDLHKHESIRGPAQPPLVPHYRFRPKLDAIPYIEIKVVPALPGEQQRSLEVRAARARPRLLGRGDLCRRPAIHEDSRRPCLQANEPETGLAQADSLGRVAQWRRVRWWRVIDDGRFEHASRDFRSEEH